MEYMSGNGYKMKEKKTYCAIHGLVPQFIVTTTLYDRFSFCITNEERRYT